MSAVTTTRPVRTTHTEAGLARRILAVELRDELARSSVSRPPSASRS